MNRRKAREKALQTLFQLDMNNGDLTNKVSDEENEFLTTLINGVSTHAKEIDDVISNHLENWAFERIAFVEKTALRIAVFEMMYLSDIPVNVTINEAVELAKVFGDEKSGHFVNGVLSKIKR